MLTESGATLSHYRLIEKIGEGGTGLDNGVPVL